jgi:mono/diheme cytochrome c family protein
MRILAAIGLIAIIVGIGAAAYFFGGFYSVAATAEESGVIHWALTQVRSASINHHAVDPVPAGLEDPARIQAGARLFATIGCVNCHGAPGVKWAKFSEGLRPDPPELKELVDHRPPSHLFWVIKNGINMTGMPAFARAAKDDELWSIVAFLKKLPIVSDSDYHGWAEPVPAAASPQPADNSPAPNK